MPERSKERTIGPLSVVPCPWCKKTNDLTDIHEQVPIEKGHRIDCDHCKRVSIVSAVDNRPRIILAQYHGG